MVSYTRKFWLAGPQLLVMLVASCLLIIAVRSLDLSIATILRPADTSGRVQSRSPIQVPLPPPPTVHIDCAAVPCLALTFDDGPNPVTTPRILDILDTEKIHATFFVVGSRVPGQEATLRRMYAAGHEIGSHSWSHPDLTGLSTGQIMQQVNQTQSVITAAGVPAASLFRPPYGAVNASVKSTVPMTLAMWNIDPLDWQLKDPAKVRDMVIAQAKPGGVIDMHDIYPVTVDSLQQTIQALRPHYQFVTFSQLFDLYPGQRGEYFGR